ncbi:hypothetical protein [Frateuria sp.]|uniref:COG4315 family predicted lipoprotein n=1 Tax=Frateuria sp. TaxID=2211372 RepID=UPI0017A86AFD|nr:hypothetical protein [Frateuria sp.]NUR21638.1 hypothetical protein [Frateuria sp.]
MDKRTGWWWIAAGMLAMAAGAVAQTMPRHGGQGRLVDGEGRALYVYDADAVPGQSACNGPCAVVWPPLEAPAAASVPQGFGVIVRADGRRQWSWHDHPLYRYAGDATPADTRGDGLNGNWHLAVDAAASDRALHP